MCEINLDVSWLVGYIANIICMGLAFLFDLPAVGSKETLSLARLITRRNKWATLRIDWMHDSPQHFVSGR